MSPPATSNVTDEEVDKRAPPFPSSPDGPPGMVSVSCEPGTRGAASSYESVVAFGCTHFPATGGASVGVTLPSTTGAEKVTDNVVFVATFCAAVEGVEDVTRNPTSDARNDAEGSDEERRDAGACPRWDGAE
jgi:hypothetical protein